ncbi:hypothetical protein A2U01_0032498, partial [Trifolium medium]|nr:hypothetical protein [Trifolium medium]
QDNMLKSSINRNSRPHFRRKSPTSVVFTKQQGIYYWDNMSLEAVVQDEI